MKWYHKIGKNYNKKLLDNCERGNKIASSWHKQNF